MVARSHQRLARSRTPRFRLASMLRPMFRPLLGLVCLAACSSPAHDEPDASSDAPAPDAEVDDVHYPDPDWQTGSPESQGMASGGLDQAAVAADASGSYCLLVIRHGVLVSEHYFNGATATTTPR